MAVDLGSEPNYGVLIEALIEKTRAGKLQWRETAEENTFFATVKGKQTFEVQSKLNEQGSVQILNVKDENGKLIIRYVSGDDAALDELYRLARRIGMRVDEKIDSSLELLNSL